MKIQTSREGSTLKVKLTGRMDSGAAPQVQQEIQSALGDARSLILDLSGVDYMSSAGLRVMHALQTTMNQRDGMQIIGVQDRVREVFCITGFDRLLRMN